MFFPNNDRIPIDPFKPTTYMTDPWISVTSRLPPEDPMSGGNYRSIPVHIFWRESDSESMICTGVYAFKRKRWYTVPDDQGDYELQNVTHWTHLIPPPNTS